MDWFRLQVANVTFYGYGLRNVFVVQNDFSTMRKHKHKLKTLTNRLQPLIQRRTPTIVLSSSTFVPTLLVSKKIFVQNAKRITFVPTNNCGNGRIDILTTGHY